MWATTSFSVLVLATGALAAIGPSANLFVANKVISPDGSPRSAVLAGSSRESVQFPGPLIRGKKGDAFNLNVIDLLTDTRMLTNTSIHWHGLFQKGSSWADGPVGVTQCPITAGHSFLYQFKVPDQAGTFWYHSHSYVTIWIITRNTLATQYCDGLRGPLIVYDPHDSHKALYDVDDESVVITLTDWYHIFARDAPPGPSPVLDATLINGLGRTQSGPASALSVIKVQHGKRYRFRLVSTSCDPFYNFSIDGHNMTIIEVDGTNVKPLLVKSIQIFAGQRYSFVLFANQPRANYWIHAIPDRGYNETVNNANSAILRYLEAEDSYPKGDNTAPRTAVFNETDLHPLVKTRVSGVHKPGHADYNLTLPITIDPVTSRFLINGTTFDPPPLPVLLQILSKKYSPQDLLNPEQYYTLPPNKVIEITIPGGSLGSPHPFHLHGHNFHVIRSAGSESYNFEDPVIRDVVNIGASIDDKVTIRFVTDNSGLWIMHCHIDWHFERGLAIVFAEDIKGIKQGQHPPALDELCVIADHSTPGLPH